MPVAKAHGVPRIPRRLQHGEYHHVVNRGNVRATLFFDWADYQAFASLLARTVREFPLPLLGYCLMPNHWHLLVVPPSQQDLSRAMHWLTSTHAHRWCKAHERKGPGHVYQGRFTSVPVEPGVNVCRVLRYVERNASEAGLARRAEQWPWGSAYQRLAGAPEPALLPQPFLPADQWLEHLNAPHVDKDIAEAIRRNLPIGSDVWKEARAVALGVGQARPRGRRPRKRGA